MKNINKLSIKELYQYRKMIEDDMPDIFGIFELFGMDGNKMSVKKFEKNWIKIQQMELKTKKLKSIYYIRGKKFKIELDIKKIKASQFIDFQHHISNGKVEEVLSVFIIPKGYDYNNGYDILKVQKLLLNKMNIEDALGYYQYFLDGIKSIARDYEGIFGDVDFVDDYELDEDTKPKDPFVWIKAADNVAEVARIPLLETFELNVIEFLNLMSYVIHKNKEIEKQYKK